MSQAYELGNQDEARIRQHIGRPGVQDPDVQENKSCCINRTNICMERKAGKAGKGERAGCNSWMAKVVDPDTPAHRKEVPSDISHI